MTRRLPGAAAVAFAAAVSLAVLAWTPPPAPRYVWRLPPGFPTPNVPADNPMTAEKVALGRRLFYDTRLSGNGTFSCASCHQQRRAFADSLPRGVGSTGEMHPRGSMSLANVAYAPVLTWGNPNVKRLEQQALLPMFGETPVELGLAGKEDTLLARLRADPRYPAWFGAAFPGESAAITIAHVTQALAAFERTLISGASPYDRYQQGERGAISAAAARGEALFFGERLECFHCHGGFNLTNTVHYAGKGFPEIEFHNTGLYNIGGTGAYPRSNPGIREFTGRADDMGKFKAPSLRNVALTAPYMHDGSIATLEDVLDHYAAGGRTIVSGPNAGVGAANPFKSGFVQGFTLTSAEKAEIVAFLRALTDSAFVTDTALSNPWRDTLPPLRRGAP